MQINSICEGYLQYLSTVTELYSIHLYQDQAPDHEEL